MLAYTAGDALNAIRRVLGVASTSDWAEPTDIALNANSAGLIDRLVMVIRRFRSIPDLDDNAF